MGKRFMSLMLTLCLLVTTVGPVLAEDEPKVSLEQAMAVAKQVLELPEDAKNVEVNYFEGGFENQSPVWNLGWNIQSGQMFRYMSVGVDAKTGELRHLSADEDMWRNRDSYKGQPKFSKEDAKQAVNDFLLKYSPEKLKTLTLKKVSEDYFYLDENTKVQRYMFQYEHRYKGVITENSMSVGYDPYKGRVFSLWSNWTNPADYPDPSGVISPEEAKQIFIDKIGLQLMYYRQDIGMPILNKEPKLVYLSRQRYEFGNPYIDAKTGELFSPYGDPRILTTTAKVQTLEPILAGPVAAEPPVLAKELTMEEARQKAEAFIKLPEDFQLTSRRYNETVPTPGLKTWSFDWNDKAGKANYSVSVDVTTGEITSFNMWNGEPENGGREPKVTWEQGKEAAIKFVKERMPIKATQLALENQQNNIPYEKAIYYPRYSYSFVRLVNGIPYNGNKVNIEVDNNTGEVSGCWSSWEQRDFKPIGEVVSPAAAMATYLKDAEFELRYVRVDKMSDAKAKLLPEYRAYEYKIAYVPSGKLPDAINARTGDAIPMWDYSVGEEARRVIGKHWAVEQVVGLVQSGIVQGDGKDFKLNEAITRAEFAKLLVKAGDLEVKQSEQSAFEDVSKDAWFYPYVATANLSGVVNGDGHKFRPNEPVSRQEMAVMLARLIEKQGYKFQDATKVVKFKDADQFESYAKAPVNKLAQLGLVSGDKDQNFRPKAKSTRAEAMNMIYLMLAKAN